MCPSSSVIQQNVEKYKKGGKRQRKKKEPKGEISL
jgi:hypothetical protein